MNQYQAKNIINLAIAGHSGSGKTSLAEAMLYLAGASDRRGKVNEGNTVCDSDKICGCSGYGSFAYF